MELRRQSDSLGTVAETLVDECLSQNSSARPCYDNVTLMIISLADYYADFERKSVLHTPQQLALRKQSSVGHAPYEGSSQHSQHDHLVECHSILQLSSGEGRYSGVSCNASQESTSAAVNPFLIASNPSS